MNIECFYSVYDIDDSVFIGKYFSALRNNKSALQKKKNNNTLQSFNADRRKRHRLCRFKSDLEIRLPHRRHGIRIQLLCLTRGKAGGNVFLKISKYVSAHLFEV